MMTAEELIDEGNTELAMGEMERAVEWFEKATVADPDSFDAWYALGVAKMKLGDYPAAIQAGKKAIELRPNEQMGYTSLSMTYARDGQIQEAEDMAAKARMLSWGGKIDPGKTE
ncbi:MAG: tetratricopeptide repeat protein [Verrucomicrobiota bacterium]